MDLINTPILTARSPGAGVQLQEAVADAYIPEYDMDAEEENVDIRQAIYPKP